MKITKVLKSMYDSGKGYEAASIISYIKEVGGLSSLIEDLYYDGLVLYSDPLEGYILYPDDEISQGIKEGYIEERYIIK